MAYPDAPVKERGLSLLEASVTLLLLILVILGLIQGIRINVRQATAVENRQENHLSVGRVTSQLTEELLSSSWGLDPQGIPYLIVLGQSEHGWGSTLEFRTIDRFVVDGQLDQAWPRYSSPIRFFVNEAGQFVRSQDGSQRVLGTGFREVRFTVTSEVAIRVELYLDSIRHPEGVEAQQKGRVAFQIQPLNGVRAGR